MKALLDENERLRRQGTDYPLNVDDWQRVLSTLGIKPMSTAGDVVLEIEMLQRGAVPTECDLGCSHCQAWREEHRSDSVKCDHCGETNCKGLHPQPAAVESNR